MVPTHKTTNRVHKSIILAFATAWIVCSSVCQALSNSAATSISNPLQGILGNNNNNNNNKIRIEFFDPNVESKEKLQSLRDCRRTAFDANKQNWLDSERDFIQAQKVVDGMNLCAIALDGNTIVGSADLTPTQKGKNMVTNVFVTPSQRGKGIGELLMVQGIEQCLAQNLPETNVKGNEATISLDVYTNNKPAFCLYEKLGYEPSSAMHAGTLAMAKTLGANFVVTLSKTVTI